MMMLRLIVAALVLTQCASYGAAESCTSDQFARIVDETGAKLRQANAKSEADFHKKFLALAKKRKWPSDQAIERGFKYLQDDQTRTLDAQASELLIRLDILGDVDAGRATCQRLDELKRVADQLLEVTAAKRSHISAKLAVAIEPRFTKKATPRHSGSAKASPAELAKRENNSESLQVDGKHPSPKWTTETKSEGLPSGSEVSAFRAPRSSVLARDVVAALPTIAAPENMTYGSEEIRAAGRGLFGTLSAELASVIKFAFDSYGKPNGFILGSEAGASFLAGLRYGKGHLVTKQFERQAIFWQGPSIGTDFGITGSRVMILVYNLKSPDQVYRRFVGVEGAAYLVGGVGITFHKQGNLVLAPIRTGLGLRIGANVGYLKITRERNYNPF